MVCRRCGKEVDPEDRFCRACGTPVKRAEDAAGEKQPGYKDDIESTMGRFDGKYMLMAAILLAVLVLIGTVRQFIFKQQTTGEAVVETTVVEE